MSFYFNIKLESKHVQFLLLVAKTYNVKTINYAIRHLIDENIHSFEVICGLHGVTPPYGPISDIKLK